jgi:DNA-binding CsgD family transcriptional regulator
MFVSDQGSERDQLETLLQRLVNCAMGVDGSPHQRTENSSEEVILDLDVDGCRYLLIRMPHTQRTRVQLSPREQEIVRMVALGHPNKIIADVLNISSWTVCTHLRRIFAKLGVASRAAMVARIHESGAIDPGRGYGNDFRVVQVGAGHSNEDGAKLRSRRA